MTEHPVLSTAVDFHGASQGGFALVGVLIGGLVTSATTLHVERRRERRAVRAAARQLGEALRKVHVFAWAAEREGWPYWGDGDFTRVTSLWTEHEALLAAGLRPGQWDALIQGIDGADGIERHRPTDQVIPDRPPLTENERGLMDFDHARVEVAVRVLRRISGVPWLTGDAWTRQLIWRRVKRRLGSLVSGRSR